MIAAAIIVIAILPSGCGNSRDAAQAQHAPTLGETHSASATASVTVHSPGLTVTLAAKPKRPTVGSPIVFTATAYARHAPGALGYQLHYGDGTSAPQSAVPLFCLPGKGSAARRTWHFSHRYGKPGTYTASLTVHVNCSGDRVTATVTVQSVRK